MTAATKPGKQGPLPLVIGVTGHRDLRPEDVPVLEEKVRAIFVELQEKHPQTPMILLSPLAEGADRLVARVALERGVRLISPLPLMREEYMRDFTTPEVQAEFTRLLEKADRWLELPLLPGNLPENIQENERRADQYAFVGAYIVRHCQILIALWNGVLLQDGGGTGQIVGFQCEGIPDRYREGLSDDGSPSSVLDPPETGPTYHIVTPRNFHPGLKGDALSLKKYFPGDIEGDEEDAEMPESGPTLERIYSNINTFNIDALWADNDPQLRDKVRQNAGYLLPEEIAKELPAGLQTLRQQYAVADTLAQYFQQRTIKILKWLSVIVFLSALSFELTAKLAPDNGKLALIFPLMIGVAWAIWYATVSRGKWQDRYQDYRALAEGLRIEFFWRLGGISTSVSEHYLRKQRGELDWIRIAIHNMSESAATELFVHPEAKDYLGLVMEHWVQNQRKYFSRAARRDDHELMSYETVIKALIAASPGIALLTALTDVIHNPVGEWIHHNPLAHKLLIIAVFVLAGLAGVLHTYIDKRALSEHTKQYERMATLFALAEERMRKRLAEKRNGEARRILLELGKESLAENGDWLMTHRNRPVDVPHAG